MNTTSRFSQVSRRAFVSGSATLASLVGLSACSNDSALTSSSSSSSTSSGSNDSSAAASSSASATSSSTSSSQAAAASGSLVVEFTVQSASSSGRGGARNPYIAVWVETASGDFVQTISLWHLQGGNDRWLADLRAWYTASGGAETNSGATRSAGNYTVEWDLTDASGAKVPAGDYVLNIEGAREHGNYELLTANVTIGSTAAKGDFADQNDITAASWSYQP